MSLDRIKFVTDRVGHDRRYAIDCGKTTADLGYVPVYQFETGIEATINWYLRNDSWWGELID